MHVCYGSPRMNTMIELPKLNRTTLRFAAVVAAVTLSFASGVQADSVDSAWTQLTPSGSTPAARTTHTSVYDEIHNRMIVFGGMGNPLSIAPLFGDTWVLTNANGLSGTPGWSQVVPTNSPPSARAYASAVYDSNNNRMILFGGNPNVGYCGVDVSDVWVLVNANGLGGSTYWIQLAPTNAAPSGRAHNSAVYDGTSNRLILFGGNNECATAMDELWILSNANGLGGAPSWKQIIITNGPVPSARNNHAAVFDGANNRMMLFGGLTSDNIYTNDVWVLTNASSITGQSGWQRLVTTNGPSGRGSHTAVYNPVSNEMFVFGGDAPGLTNDVWRLSNANGLGGGATWLRWVAGQLPPVERDGHTAVLNVASNQMVVYAGQACNAGCSALSDVWTLNLTTPIQSPIITSVTPGSGTEGTNISIIGSHLRYTTNVSFNGQSAIFTNNNSDTEITAVVPPCAASGYVTVTTPAGTAASAAPFTVPRVSVVISDFTESTFNAAICHGNSITFAGDGTISFTSAKVIAADMTIDGSGHNITFSGGNATRLFSVNPGIQLTLKNVTIANATSTNGGALFNNGGGITIVNCTFTNNRAVGSNGAGGIVCKPGGAGVPGLGGAIFNKAGTLWISNCVFVGNTARGGAGGNGGPNGFGCTYGAGGAGADASGGALYSTNGVLSIFNCSFQTNNCYGGNGGNPGGGTLGGGFAGWARGGSICVSGGSLSINRCTFLRSSLIGGNGGSSGGSAGTVRGGAVYLENATAYLFDIGCSSNTLTGGTGAATTVTFGNFGNQGGAGGSAAGGAIYSLSGLLMVTNATFDRHVLTGGNGGSGAYASIGGNGGVGGSTVGGGVFLNSSSNVLVNVTCYSNYLASGNGGNQGGGTTSTGTGGSGGETAGAAVFNNAGTNTLINCTFALGSLRAGTGGAGSIGPTIIHGSNLSADNGALVLKNTLIAYGQMAANCFGTNIDAGNNLSTDSSGNFSAPSSFNSANPYLGQLADNGGPTLTMAISPPSVAINGGDSNAAPSTDQRSYLRIGAPDIGAYEYNGVAAIGDDDGDGLPNWWEVAHGLNPRSSASTDGPLGDPDFDGCDNWHEFIADTDPQTADSFPRLTGLALLPGAVRIQWQAGNQSTQYLQRRFTFDPGDQWQDIFTNLPPTPATNDFTNSLNGTGMMLYRLRLAR